MSTEALPRRFDEFDGNIVLDFNPTATATSSASRTKKEEEHVGAEFLSMLTEEYNDRVVFVRLNSDPEVRKQNRRKLIVPRSIVVIGGGEGAVAEVADFLRTDPFIDDGLRSTALVLAPFGNANNTASELTPSPRGEKPRIQDIFQYGRVIDAYGATLRVSSDHPESDGIDQDITEYTSVSCHSMQVGGKVGEALNNVRGNGLRHIKACRYIVDGFAVKKAIKHSEQIEMTINGETVQCIGSIGVSSQVYLGVLKTPASVAEQAFYETMIEKGSTAYLGKMLVSHVAGRLDWRKVEGDEVLRYELLAQPGQQLLIEADAEPYLLPSHPSKEVRIRVDVSPQQEPFRVFSTNPSLIDQAA